MDFNSDPALASRFRELNLLFTLGMRYIGEGRGAGRKLCRYMSLSCPVYQHAYTQHTKWFGDNARMTTEVFLSEAASEL